MALSALDRVRLHQSARRPVERQRAGAASVTRSRPAPIGGLNLRDPLDSLPETDAIRLVNMIPGSSKVTTRPGKTAHATGLGGEVKTLDVWEGASSSKMLAGAQGDIWDVTSAGAASTISSSAGYTEDQWQTFNFNGYIFGLNGADAPWDYDGTTFQSTSWSGSGLTITNLIGGTSYQERVFLVENNSGDVWYGASGAVTGSLTKFALSQIAEHGGYLMAVGTWSRDGGSGLDDLIVFVMSTGEIIVYQGTDPSSSGAFWKQGSYLAAPPIGRRCVRKLGGDLVVLTRRGPLPVSLIMQGWTIDSIYQRTMWGKVAPGFQSDAALHSSKSGWEIAPLFDNGRMYFNVPEVQGAEYEQYVLFVNTGAWAKLEDINARCWTHYSGDAYFGSIDGQVMKHSGITDDGTAIAFDAKGAFTYLDDRNRRKLFSAVRPIINFESTLTCSIGLDLDFSDRYIPAGLLSLSALSGGSAWDEDNWDDGIWADDPAPNPQWISAGGEGRNAAMRFFGTASTEISWFSTDYMVKVGGNL